VRGVVGLRTATLAAKYTSMASATLPGFTVLSGLRKSSGLWVQGSNFPSPYASSRRTSMRSAKGRLVVFRLCRRRAGFRVASWKVA